jgi:LPXTG-site transpeptidase (sortase) family protein
MRKPKNLTLLTISIILALFLSSTGPALTVAAAGISPTLGASGSFSIIAYSQVTNVPTSSISGNVAVYPGSATPGLTAAEVGGTIYLANAQALAAKSDAQAAYTNLNGQTCDHSYLGVTDLTLLSSLGPGVYCAPGGFILTGNLNLTGSGVWIFKSGSTIITSPSSSVTGGDPCNLWWTAVSSVTLDTTTAFRGTVIASDSITMNTNATLNGRVWALNGAVTLDHNTINGPTCGSTPTVTTTASGPVTVGDAITDTLHLSGGSSPTGGIAFDLYAPGDTTCATLLTTLTGPAISGAGNYTSSSFATTTIGNYRWKAHYSGDANNTNINTACNDPNEISVVNARPPAGLPSTGFAPQHVTVLPAQPADKTYMDLGNLWMEIPRLGVQMPITGVPQAADGSWDVSWLGNNAGWLQGTAFPTWAGNSVLTGHVYDAFGNPGPFVHLNWLWWGDNIIVHADGAQYVYAVRTVMQVQPNDVAAMMKHEQPSWITLVTCRGYDEASNSYKYRVLIRAVLVEVK